MIQYEGDLMKQETEVSYTMGDIFEIYYYKNNPVIENIRLGKLDLIRNLVKKALRGHSEGVELVNKVDSIINSILNFSSLMDISDKREVINVRSNIIYFKGNDYVNRKVSVNMFGREIVKVSFNEYTPLHNRATFETKIGEISKAVKGDIAEELLVIIHMFHDTVVDIDLRNSNVSYLKQDGSVQILSIDTPSIYDLYGNNIKSVSTSTITKKVKVKNKADNKVKTLKEKIIETYTNVLPFLYEGVINVDNYRYFNNKNDETVRKVNIQGRLGKMPAYIYEHDLNKDNLVPTAMYVNKKICVWLVEKTDNTLDITPIVKKIANTNIGILRREISTMFKDYNKQLEIVGVEN